MTDQRKLKNRSKPKYVSIEGCSLPQEYQLRKSSIDNFEVFDSDIWICSYPRTGTTWMSEMVWLIANDCDFEKAKSSMWERIRFLEFSTLFDGTVNPQEDLHDIILDSITYTKNHTHPRVIKTHLPFYLLPKQIQNGDRKPRIFYTCRNPLDVCVSYYYHMASINYHGSFEEYCEQFLAGKVLYGSYWAHIIPFWKIRDQPNVVFLKYEDMKKNLPEMIRKTASLLKKTLSVKDMESLLKHLSFDSMKSNSAINGGDILEYTKKDGSIKSDFVRSGVIGGYKKEMPEKFVRIIQERTKKELEGTGLHF